MTHDLAQLLRDGRFAAAKWHTTIVAAAWLIDHPHKREPDRARVVKIMGISDRTFYRGLEGVRKILCLSGQREPQANAKPARSTQPCERSKL